jgi:hypothetical protein
MRPQFSQMRYEDDHNLRIVRSESKHSFIVLDLLQNQELIWKTNVRWIRLHT